MDGVALTKAVVDTLYVWNAASLGWHACEKVCDPQRVFGGDDRRSFTDMHDSNGLSLGCSVSRVVRTSEDTSVSLGENFHVACKLWLVGQTDGNGVSPSPRR